MLVETVFQYRTLIGKCELGCGLEWAEIEELAQIEHAFAAPKTERDGLRSARGVDRRSGRRFRREKVQLAGFLRGDRINDPVAIAELGPGGLICRNAPFIARGEQVEVVLDVGNHSYRFHARGVWLKDDGDDYRVGLAFVGMPVRLHAVQVRRHVADVIDKIARAA